MTLLCMGQQDFSLEKYEPVTNLACIDTLFFACNNCYVVIAFIILFEIMMLNTISLPLVAKFNPIGTGPFSTNRCQINHPPICSNLSNFLTQGESLIKKPFLKKILK